jgi:hypothetical protein
MTLTEKRLSISRRAMLLSAATTPAFVGIGQIAAPERIDAAENPSAEDAPVKNAVDAYVYLYPLVVFGRTMEVLTNVERPTWQKLSAPLNQLMSVRYNDPSNHGVIVPSTDTLYSAVLADVTKEPLVVGVPAIPDIPGTNRKRFMMYQFIGAWSNVFFSSGLRRNQVNKTNFIIIGPDFGGSLPDIPDALVVQAPTNQSWLALRTQVESTNDLDNVHAIQDSYTVTPLSMYGKHYEAPPGVVNPNIPTDRGLLAWRPFWSRWASSMGNRLSTRRCRRK